MKNFFLDTHLVEKLIEYITRPRVLLKKLMILSLMKQMDLKMKKIILKMLEMKAWLMP
jgi:hypothetical protein